MTLKLKSSEIIDLIYPPDSYGLKCPKCGFEFNHIIGVRVVEPEGIKTNIDFGKLDTVPKGSVPYGYGNYIEIYFECESGHLWKMSFRFHKGQVLVETEYLEDVH